MTNNKENPVTTPSARPLVVCAAGQEPAVPPGVDLLVLSDDIDELAAIRTALRRAIDKET